MYKIHIILFCVDILTHLIDNSRNEIIKPIKVNAMQTEIIIIIIKHR